MSTEVITSVSVLCNHSPQARFYISAPNEPGAPAMSGRTHATVVLRSVQYWTVWWRPLSRIAPAPPRHTAACTHHHSPTQTALETAAVLQVYRTTATTLPVLQLYSCVPYMHRIIVHGENGGNSILKTENVFFIGSNHKCENECVQL